MPKATGKRIVQNAKAGKKYFDIPVTQEYKVFNNKTGIEDQDGNVVRRMENGKLIPYKSTGESGPKDFTKAARLKRLNRGS